MYAIERRLRHKGIRFIAGVDEAGRGPLAGPVIAAAVILPWDKKIKGIRDSKQLTPLAREKCFVEILRLAQVGIGAISCATIDKINILEATRLAMQEAVANLPLEPEFLLIDGTVKLGLPIKKKMIIKGDQKSASIAAASIVAKVTRDQMMLAYDRLLPFFGFAKHKGYPTTEHLKAVGRLGASPIHRLSFKPVRKVANLGLYPGKALR